MEDEKGQKRAERGQGRGERGEEELGSWIKAQSEEEERRYEKEEPSDE